MAMTDAIRSYEQIVFSGGGIRCFWHGGWMRAVERVAQFRPERVTGVSGGALSAAAWIGDRERDLVAIMADAFRGEDSNLTAADLGHDKPGRTPYQRVYRKVVEALVSASARAAIAEGPSFQILLGRPVGGALTQAMAILAGTAYELEKRLHSRPRSALPDLIGMESDLIDARQASRDGRLTDLICAAAAISPVFRIPDWDGRPACDGAMVDQIPLPEPDRGQTLLLLSRTYDTLPEDTDRLHHVTPSEKPVDGKIDFTEPAKVERAWRLGEKDGRLWLRTVASNIPD
ncbi:MAG: patatin-like phospholipase family protein [Roseicyclus sp.]